MTITHVTPTGTTVKALQLAKDSTWKRHNRGFKMPKGDIVWTDAHLDFDKDRKRVRISRVEFGYEYRRYIDPHKMVELVKK